MLQESQQDENAKVDRYVGESECDGVPNAEEKLDWAIQATIAANTRHLQVQENSDLCNWLVAPLQ